MFRVKHKFQLEFLQLPQIPFSPSHFPARIVVADNYELQFVKQGVIQDHRRSYHKCHFDKNYVVLRMSWKQWKVYICCRAFCQVYMRWWILQWIDNSNIQSRKTSPNNILTKFCKLCQSRTSLALEREVRRYFVSRSEWWGISQQVRRLWFNWGSSLPSTPLPIQLYHVKLNVLLTAFLAFPTLHYKQPSSHVEGNF